MKNKFLNLLLVFCLIIPCVCCFSACDDKTPPQTPPTVVHVTESVDLASAINQVANGGKVVLDVNVTLSNQLNINKKVEIDLNGKIINNTEDIRNIYQKDASGEFVLDGESNKIELPIEEQSWSLISVRENGDLTISNHNGRFEAKLDDCYVVDVRGGKLTIESGQFMGNISAVYVHSGEAIINDGTFGIQQLAEGTDEYALLLDCNDENYENETAVIILNGGLFVGYNPMDAVEENFLSNGLSIVECGENVYHIEPIIVGE